jgi:hypothetical protein
VWKEVKRRPSEREPAFILRARAKATPYPQRLRWYGKLGDNETVVAEYKDHSSLDLEDEYREVVINALVALEDYRSAVDLVKVGGSWSSVRRFLMELSNSEADMETARALLGTYLIKGVEKGEFRQVIEDVKPGKTDITVLASLLSDEQSLVATEAFLIKLLARSQALADERSDEKFVSGTIHGIAKKKASQLTDLVSPEEVGAALERAGRMDNALMFYESVFNEDRWGKDTGTRQNAQVRWLKCKERQAELDRKDEQRRHQRLAEAKRMSSDWGVLIPEEEFPVISSLTPNEIESLLGAISRPSGNKGFGSPPTIAPETETPEPELSSETGDAGTREEAANVEPGGSDVGVPESSPGGETSETGSKLSSWLLPSRPAFAGRIEFSCNCEGKELKARLLPLKRRLELIDDSNDDTVLIKVGKGQVESDDLLISAVEQSVWTVDPWLLTISFIAMDAETILVDLSASGGRRILCLVV